MWQRTPRKLKSEDYFGVVFPAALAKSMDVISAALPQLNIKIPHGLDGLGSAALEVDMAMGQNKNEVGLWFPD